MKRNLYWLAILTLLLALIAFSSGIANAEATPAADFEYTVNDGSAAITKYTGSATDVMVPDTLDGNPVTAIEDQAFMFCDSVETVTIPASVTRIGRDAFSQVPISAVNVAAANEAYASIDGVLFNKDCTTLIYYPSGRSAAQYPTYTVPDSVTEIGKNAFLQSLLQHITLPEHLTVIGEGAFAQCMSLAEIYVPDGVTAIDTDTFYLCSNLTEISLPAGLISVSGFAFAEVPTCTINYRGPAASVPNIDIGEYNGCLFSSPWHCTDGDYVFSDSGTCGEHLTWAYSGNTLTISGTGPMENYNDYGGAPWFKYAPVITHVVIDNGVTSIGDWAFSAFESLTGVPLPASLATIGNNAFNNCWRLTDVYYPGTEAQWNAITIGEGNDSLTSATIFYNSHPDSQLPTPVIANVNTGGTIGRDVGFDYHCAEGTERVSLMVGLVDDSGNFEPLESFGISDYDPYIARDAVQLEGYHFQTPGTYQIRIKAYTWYYGEQPSETIADSETAIYEFTLEDAELPTITVELSATKTEYDYGDSELDNLTYSISGVDNVALAWWVYSEQTDDVNGSSLSGGYESFGRLYADAGRNEYTFYGRVNGVWSKPVTKIITVFPLLDVPAIYYNGNYVDSAWIITDGESPIFTVECDNATAFTCTVLKELEDGSEDTLAYAESSNGVIDLTSYNLPLGTYYLSFGVSSDRWTSPDNKRITLTITDSPVLPAPTITVAPGTSHQDMAITVTGSEDTDKIEVSVEGIMNNGEGNELYSGSVNNGGTLTVPGWFIDGNNYKITATGKRLESEEGSAQTWAYGNQAVLTVTREDPEPEPTHTNTMTFNTTEGVSGQVTLWPKGWDFNAYRSVFNDASMQRSMVFSIILTVVYTVMEIDCWARFSGYWYWVNSGEVTLLPSAELAVPAVSLNGRALTRNTLQTVALADPMTLSASCADADGIGYVVQKVNGSFNMDLVRFTEDGSYVEYGSHTGLDGYDDNDYAWENYFADSRLGTASSVNILDQLTLTPGDYRVRIVAACEDTSIKAGQFVAWLHLVPAPGTCGLNLTWALNDGTLTISGTGDMFDYDWNTGAPWKDTSADIHTVVVESGVTGIGNYAFNSCEALTSVTLPEGLTRIGNAAFMQSGALTDVTLPSTLKIIGPSAFESTGIQEITLYDGLTSIGEYAFMNSALRKINIPAGTATKNEVFFVHNWQKDKDELIRVTVPASVTDVDVSDFFGTFLPAVEPGFVTPADLTTIESEAFSGIAASYIWLTDNVQSIGANAFSGCTGLQYIRIPNNCTSFGANAFPAGTILLVDYNADAYDALEAAGYTNIMKLVEGFNG